MIRFINGPHVGKVYPAGQYVSGFYRVVIPDCGCIYQGWAVAGQVVLEYQGKTQDVPVPEAYTKAFADAV